MRIDETCACGATFSLTEIQNRVTTALTAADAWRADHRHEPQVAPCASNTRSVDPEPTGGLAGPQIGAERCHCGEPVAYAYDGDPTHHRGMCRRCDSTRCDAYPGDCGRPSTSGDEEGGL